MGIRSSDVAPLWDFSDGHVSEVNPVVCPSPVGLNPTVWHPGGSDPPMWLPPDPTVLHPLPPVIDGHTAELIEYSLRACCCL
jgi:hypothetical protein